MRFSGLLPCFPEGFATNLTPFPVIWFAINDMEGNAAGVNHAIKKYPLANEATDTKPVQNKIKYSILNFLSCQVLSIELSTL